MLSYILENKEVNGVKTVERFREKFADDPATFMLIDNATKGETETILFNIDIEGPINKDMYPAKTLKSMDTYRKSIGRNSSTATISNDAIRVYSLLFRMPFAMRWLRPLQNSFAVKRRAKLISEVCVAYSRLLRLSVWPLCFLIPN